MLEEDAFGAVHPRDAMLPEAVLLFCAYIQELLEAGRLERQENETVILEPVSYTHLDKYAHRRLV